MLENIFDERSNERIVRKVGFNCGHLFSVHPYIYKYAVPLTHCVVRVSGNAEYFGRASKAFFKVLFKSLQYGCIKLFLANLSSYQSVLTSPSLGYYITKFHSRKGTVQNVVFAMGHISDNAIKCTLTPTAMFISIGKMSTEI